MEKCVDHYTVVIFMTIVTAYSLFFDDIRVLLIPKSADEVFYMITFGCLCSFAIEIIIASYCKEDYIGTFFFWLDIISTVSMIPDIPWIWEPIIGEGSGGGGDATQIAQTSRAGRVTRVIRGIRLIRLIRIVKLYKQQQLLQKKNDDQKHKTENQQRAQKSLTKDGGAKKPVA